MKLDRLLHNLTYQRPFTHQLGARILLPCSTVEAICYPQKLLFNSGDFQYELLLQFNKLVKDFTCTLDLKTGHLCVQGIISKKPFRYRVYQKGGKICLIFDKIKDPVEVVLCFESKSQVLPIIEKQEIQLFSSISFKRSDCQKVLFLGSYKKLEWERICKSNHLIASLPLIYHYGQFFSQAFSEAEGAIFDFIEGQLCKTQSRDVLEQNWQILLQVFFSNLLFPHLEDEAFQGLELSPLENNDPFPKAYLLHLLHYKIQQLFIQYEASTLSLLPRLLAPFDCGSLINLRFPGLGKIHFTWSKHHIRSLIIEAEANMSFILNFPQKISFFRLKNASESRSVYVKVGNPLHIKEGNHYYLDRFTK